AAVIAGALVLLVRGVVLFVDDNHADAFERCEHGRPRADHDVDFSAADALPLVVAFAGGKAAVLNRHTIAELLTKNGGECRRQRNFGYEDQGLATLMADRRGETEIDFGFTAAGHAVKEGDVKTASVCERVEPCEGGCLLGGQFSTPTRLRPHSDP